MTDQNGQDTQSATGNPTATEAPTATETQAPTEATATAEPTRDGKSVGTVEQVTGVVIDVAFPDHIPEIFHALRIDIEPEGGRTEGRLILEVQQHLGDDRVRAIAMDATDGVKRGDKVIDTGGPISVPVGKETLGRIFNLLGETIDEGEAVNADTRWPIHRDAPDVEN